ncbi:MAG: DUF5685 family protein [Saccharofermentanales bacterium]
MFGYLRPDKDTLMVKEFTMFRAVYCGICKEIKRSYGNIPRLALSYDMTVLAILLLSMADDDAMVRSESCILNPLKKKPVSYHHFALEFCAASSVIFTYYKLQDEILDAGSLNAKVAGVLLSKAYKKARNNFPATDKTIAEGIGRLAELERFPPDAKSYVIAADTFGGILRNLMAESFKRYFEEDAIKDKLVAGITLLGAEIGKWIYIMDAIEDYDKDKLSYEWNPFSGVGYEEAAALSAVFLEACETRCDELAALLPYRRYAGIISNVFQAGMPQARNKIMNRQKLGRL